MPSTHTLLVGEMLNKNNNTNYRCVKLKEKHKSIVILESHLHSQGLESKKKIPTS